MNLQIAKMVFLASALGLAMVPLAAGQGGWGGGTKVKADHGFKAGEYMGLKHAIGVRNFRNESGWEGRWRLGENLTEMLEAALIDSGRFVVLQREQLNAVLAEQDLMARGRADDTVGVARKRHFLPARFIASGAVVDVEEEVSLSDAAVRLDRFRIGSGRAASQITVVVTVTDTTTGEIVAKERVVGRAGSVGWRVGYSGNFEGEVGSFARTPLGEAAQHAVEQAVAFLSATLAKEPFEAHIVGVSTNGWIILNRGRNFGVRAGQRFVMLGEDKALIDPVTGALLGLEDGAPIGVLKVVRSTGKVSYAEVVEGEKNPARGTRVRAK